MERLHKRYTQEEKEIILEEVSLHPQNIRIGIRIAADRINRPFSAVYTYYYSVLRKNTNTIAFLTVGKTRYSVNSKNIYFTKLYANTIESPTLFKRMITWIKNKIH